MKKVNMMDSMQFIDLEDDDLKLIIELFPTRYVIFIFLRGVIISLLVYSLFKCFFSSNLYTNNDIKHVSKCPFTRY